MYALRSETSTTPSSELVYNFTFIHLCVGFQVYRFSRSNWAVPSVQYSHSVVSDFWDLMDCSMPGFPVHHQFLELAQTQVHGVSDAIQPSHPLSPPSPPTFYLSQNQGLFQGVSSSHLVAKVLAFHQGRGSLVGCRLWGRTESDTTEVT